MFDLGFWELMLIAVVVLLVVGPERLPGVARSAGLWVGRLRRFVHSVKQDIDREVAAEELQKTLSRQASVPELEEIIEETGHTIGDSRRDSLSDNQPGDRKDTPGSQEGRQPDGLKDDPA